MKVKYNREADVLVLVLSDEKPDFGEQSGDVITHYNKAGKPIEIEFLSASKTALNIIKPILSREKISA